MSGLSKVGFKNHPWSNSFNGQAKGGLNTFVDLIYLRGVESPNSGKYHPDLSVVFL